MTIKEENKWSPVNITIPVELMYNPLLSNTDKTLFGFIQNFAKQYGGCTHSNSTLSKMIFLKEQTITNAIHNLSQFKYILVIYDKENYPYRRIYLNTRIEKTYKDLVFTYHNNCKQKLDSLLTVLSDIVKKSMEEYDNLEDEEAIKNLIGGYYFFNSNSNINNNIHSSLHSSSSNNKLFSSSENVIEECTVTKVTDHTANHSSISSNKKLYTAGISLPNEVVDLTLQEGTPIPTKEGLLKRRRFTKGEMVRAKSIEKRLFIDSVQKKKELGPFKPSEEVKLIFDFWVEQGFKLRGECTKGIRVASKKVKGLLNGTLFPQLNQPFTVEDIKLSIIRHQMMAFDDNYEPTLLSRKKQLQKLTLEEFIENAHAGNGSFFLTCHKQEPKLIKTLVPDPSPALTKALKNIFAKEVCGGQVPKSYSTHEENCFRSAVAKVFKFFSSNSYNLVPRVESELIIPLCDCLKETCSGSSFTIVPGHLCSEKTFNYQLPQYLLKQGLMLR